MIFGLVFSTLEKIVLFFSAHYQCVFSFLYFLAVMVDVRIAEQYCRNRISIIMESVAKIVNEEVIMLKIVKKTKNSSTLLDDLFDVSESKPSSIPTYKKTDLVFVMFTGWELPEGIINEPTGNYHLACAKLLQKGSTKGSIRTSCGMLFFDLADVDYHYLYESKGFEVCPACSRKSGNFSKKYFNGKKLLFTKTKKKKESKQVDTEYFENTNETVVPF